MAVLGQPSRRRLATALLLLISFPKSTNAFLPLIECQLLNSAKRADAATYVSLSASVSSSTPPASAVEPMTTDSDSNPLQSSATSRKYPRESHLLQQSLRSFNSSAAQTLIQELGQMRSNGTYAMEIDAFLDTLLSSGPDKPTRLGWRPLSRFSKRARMKSLQRTLDLTTPPPSEGELDDLARRRRRALVSLLRQLAAPSDTPKSLKQRLLRTPAICIIEKKARREFEASNNASPAQQDELRSRKGQDLETPQYEILDRASIRNGGMEIRQYQPFSVCSVNMPTDNDTSTASPKTASSPGSSFNTLAAYLFGKNQAQTPMKMTTPVLMDASSENEDATSKRMSFVLPSQYWSTEQLTQAPQPFADSGVSLALQPAQTRAVIMFGGYASKTEVSRRQEQLKSALLMDGCEWEAVSGATMTLSQYNDPFTPPWKRLNEVSIEVKRKQT